MTALNQAAARLAPQGAPPEGGPGSQAEVQIGLNGAQNGAQAEESDDAGNAEAGEGESDGERMGEDEKKSAQDLTPDEQREVSDLRQRDMEVRAHEQAHVAAGGRYVTKAPSYDYESGPDGNRYAVGGEVSIDTSPVPGDPTATKEKAQVIRRAALAPAEPSTQDQRVASQARRMEAQARGEMLQENQGELSDALAKVGEPIEGDGSVGDAGSEAATAAPMDGGSRLQQRVSGFFAASPSLGLSQFA